jgi:DNA-binding NtrC family response regulator
MEKNILLLDDDTRFARELETFLAPEFILTRAASPSEALGHISRVRPDLLLLDYNLPDLSGLEFLKLSKRRFLDLTIIMLTGQSDSDTIIETMKAGADDFVIKGSEDFEANLKFRIHRALEKSALAKQNQQLAEQNSLQTERNKRLAAKIAAQSSKHEILGAAPSVLRLKSDILKLKGSPSYVLITGENGTGKELVARNINSQEDDSSRPFVAVNCAAIPAPLFESEFFGHAKGSFTGATENKVGQFKLADGGDLFLDEVGEIPLEMQAKLLRALQEQTFTPVGGTKPVTVSVRVIAATNRNLEEEVARGRFREDLFYRLNRFTIKVPALRERHEDILSLAEEFLRRILPVAKLSEPAKKFIVGYPWRGNIRELENAIERASVQVRGLSRPLVKVEHLGLSNEAPIPVDAQFIPANLLPRTKDEVTPDQFQRCLNWIEKIYFERCLQVFGGDNNALYTKLGLSKAHYFRRKKAIGLSGESEPTQGGSP